MSLEQYSQSNDVFKEEKYQKYNINSTRQNLKWVESLKNRTKQNKISNDIIFSSQKRKIKLEEMIENAKIHKEANRPLIKIKEFDGQTKVCQCCLLPSNDNIYMRTFNFCENTDNYAGCGRGISLYFSF